MTKLHKIDRNALTLDPVKLFRDDWGLLTAGTTTDYNSMTISWGCLGELWGRDVAHVFVRDSRYTYEFMDKAETFTVSFFDRSLRPVLSVLGSESGRDMDKLHPAGLTPVTLPDGIAYEEAELTIVCRTMYAHNFTEENFYDKKPFEMFYGEGGHHREYIAEIVGVYVKE